MKKKKVEWSKLFSTIIAFVLGAYGIWSGIEYYILCRAAIVNCTAMPEPTLAVVCVSTMLASLLSYLLYQLGLKNSRNKYGVDENGEPYAKTINCDEGGIMG